MEQVSSVGNAEFRFRCRYRALTTMFNRDIMTGGSYVKNNDKQYLNQKTFWVINDHIWGLEIGPAFSFFPLFCFFHKGLMYIAL